MLYKILYLFLLFFIYSVAGYIVEVIAVSISLKKFTYSRGFLIGPYIPIYGMGALCMTKLLSAYQDDLLILFVMSVLSCTILEYFTSYIMEKIFKLRWWDYSHMSFNINGRVCLTNSVLFGIGGVMITKFINPTIESFLKTFSETLVIILGLLFLIVFIIDLVISIITMFNIKVDVRKYMKKDATSIIKKEVSVALKKHLVLKERLLEAFPNAIAKRNFNFATYKDILNKLKKELGKAKSTYKKNKSRAKKQKDK